MMTTSVVLSHTDQNDFHSRDKDVRKQTEREKRTEMQIENEGREEEEGRAGRQQMCSYRSLPVGTTGSQPLGTSIRMRKRALERSRDWLELVAGR